jgi:hypothetical protein
MMRQGRLTLELESRRPVEQLNSKSLALWRRHGRPLLFPANQRSVASDRRHRQPARTHRPAQKSWLQCAITGRIGGKLKSPAQWFRRLWPEVHRRTGNAKLLALPRIIAQQSRDNQMFNIGADVGIAGIAGSIMVKTIQPPSRGRNRRARDSSMPAGNHDASAPPR